jgi:hypothetical protein
MNKLASCNQSSISTASNNKNKNNKNNSISRTICVRRTQKVKNNVLNCSTASTASTTTTTMTTEIGSTVWYEFEANVLGEFGSVTREYDYKADDHEWAGLDNPLRYVHGVGVVPISSMPFADEHLETNAKCVSKIKRSEDGKTLSVCVETKRSFAECGEEASFGSCGGSEWNERTKYAEDLPYSILSGTVGIGARTIEASGSFCAGPKRFEKRFEKNSAMDYDSGMTYFPMHEIDASIRFCLQQCPEKRCRIDFHLKENTKNSMMNIKGCTLWSERKKACAPRANNILALDKEENATNKWSIKNRSFLRVRGFTLDKTTNEFVNVFDSEHLKRLSSESLVLLEECTFLPCGNDDKIFVHHKNSDDDGKMSFACIAESSENSSAVCSTRTYDSKGICDSVFIAELM